MLMNTHQHLLIFIPLTGKLYIPQGFNLNRIKHQHISYPVRDLISIGMVALYHYGCGTSVVCTEAKHLTAAKGNNHS